MYSQSIYAGVFLFAALNCINASAQSPPEPEGEPAIRLQSVFTGDKEQPAVSYFIPWQGTTTPDRLQWEIESNHDGTLQPIDRDVMLRSMNIYNEMSLENN